MRNKVRVEHQPDKLCIMSRCKGPYEPTRNSWNLRSFFLFPMFNTYYFFACSSWNLEKSRHFSKNQRSNVEVASHRVPSHLGKPVTWLSHPHIPSMFHGLKLGPRFQEKGILALAGFLDHSRHPGESKSDRRKHHFGHVASGVFLFHFYSNGFITI